MIRDIYFIIVDSQRVNVAVINIGISSWYFDVRTCVVVVLLRLFAFSRACVRCCVLCCA